MRNEITEPQHWRANTQRTSLPTSLRSELPAAAFDAAFARDDAHGGDEKTIDLVEQLNPTDIVTNLANQLTLLEQQREHLQRLLEQASLEQK